MQSQLDGGHATQLIDGQQELCGSWSLVIVKTGGVCDGDGCAEPEGRPSRLTPAAGVGMGAVGRDDGTAEAGADGKASLCPGVITALPEPELWYRTQA